MLEIKYTIKQDFTKRVIQNFIYGIVVVRSDIRFVVSNRDINAKSLIGLLSANLTKGDEITIVVNPLGNSDVEGDLKTVLELLGDGE